MTGGADEPRTEDADGEASEENEGDGRTSSASIPPPHHPVVIVGGGIGGLVLALCLHRAYNIDGRGSDVGGLLPIHVYESSAGYGEGIGGGIGLYPNGLRVLRDADPYEHHHVGVGTSGESGNIASSELLRRVRSKGCDYIYRRWMRHDGTTVAVAREDELLGDDYDYNYNYSDRKTTTVTTIGEDSHDGGADDDNDDDDDDNRSDARPRGGALGSLRRNLSNFSIAGGGRSGSGHSSGSEGAEGESGNGKEGGNDGDEGEGEGENKKSRMIDRKGRGSAELRSLGIRRWKFQRVLHEACVKTGTVRVHFGKRLVKVESAAVARDDGGAEEDDGGCPSTSTSTMMLHFKDGTRVTTSLLIGADGVNSIVRDHVCRFASSSDDNENNTDNKNETISIVDSSGDKSHHLPEYTGVTCFMGCANVPRPNRGICFPSSVTTKCHACYYPTKVVVDAPAKKHRDGNDGDVPSSSPTEEKCKADDDNDDDNDNEAGSERGFEGKEDEDEGGETNIKHEQVFQIYFPSPIERPDEWRTLTPAEGKSECRELASRLRSDGWDEQFLEPLEHDSLSGVLRVGIRSREALDRWHCEAVQGGGGIGKGGGGGGGGRVILLGDAAHPPVPYIGQGAMMAIEDAGTLSMLLRKFCPLEEESPLTGDGGGGGMIDLRDFKKAARHYESLRISRTRSVLGSSHSIGRMQQRRAESRLYNSFQEWTIKAQVWAYGTLPVLKPGPTFDYRSAVEKWLAKEEEEEEEERG